VHARLDANGALAHLDERRGQVSILATGAPGDVDELGAKVAHTLDTVIEVLEALDVSQLQLSGLRSLRVPRLGCPRTCAVRGGKYSKLQNGRPSRSAARSLSVIFMVEWVVVDWVGSGV
jgi:hypothetical protein